MDLTGRVVPQPCITCGKGMSSSWEWYEVTSLDGVPVWRVPEDFTGTPTTEAYYCRSCFYARMDTAPGPVPDRFRPLLSLPPERVRAALDRTFGPLGSS